MVKIAQIEMMMKPTRNNCISLVEQSVCVDSGPAKVWIPSSNSSALSIRSPDQEQGDEDGQTVNQYGTKVGEMSVP